jgi:hypothetical protein
MQVRPIQLDRKNKKSPGFELSDVEQEIPSASGLQILQSLMGKLQQEKSRVEKESPPSK